MRERDYQRLVKADLMRATGLLLNKLGTMQEGAGWPDLYVPSPIWTGWIELKVGGGRLSPAQGRKIALLLERRVPALVLRRRSDDVEQFEDHAGNVLEERMQLTPKDERGCEMLLQLRGMFGDGGSAEQLLGRGPGVFSR